MIGDRVGRFASIALVLAAVGCAEELSDVIDQQPWPRKVVITNDDGVGSNASVALAQAFAQIADTYLIVPAENQSSGTNFASAARTGRFEVEERDVGPGVTAWAVNGYPADCVFFALSGPLKESPPDLVISGVNTGANLADAWILSGTVGAARVASYYGVPALAVSGIDDDDADAVATVAAWVVKFAQSEAVRRLVPPQYLTVSLPVGPMSQILGVEVTERARGMRGMTAMPIEEDDYNADGRQAWSFDVVRDAFAAAPNTDAPVVAEGRIAIVAMRVDESDPEMQTWLVNHKDLIPVW